MQRELNSSLNIKLASTLAEHSTSSSCYRW